MAIKKDRNGDFTLDMRDDRRSKRDRGSLTKEHWDKAIGDMFGLWIIIGILCIIAGIFILTLGDFGGLIFNIGIIIGIICFVIFILYLESG